MINTRLLLAQMTLKAKTTKDLADAQGWSMSTAYRKINGKAAWFVPEVQRCTDFLELTENLVNEIFFAADLS